LPIEGEARADIEAQNVALLTRLSEEVTVDDANMLAERPPDAEPKEEAEPALVAVAA
jgi:hypothetical protein